jgi:hypothetical protein
MAQFAPQQQFAARGFAPQQFAARSPYGFAPQQQFAPYGYAPQQQFFAPQPRFVEQPPVVKKRPLNPLLMLQLIEDDNYFTKNSAGTLVQNTGRNMLDTFFLNSIGNSDSFDYAMYQVLQQQRFNAQGMRLDNQDDYFLNMALTGISGPLAGAGIAQGTNTMLPYLMLQQGGLF